MKLRVITKGANVASQAVNVAEHEVAYANVVRARNDETFSVCFYGPDDYLERGSPV